MSDDESFVILGSSSLAPSLVDRDEMDTPGLSITTIGGNQPLPENQAVPDPKNKDNNDSFSSVEAQMADPVNKKSDSIKSANKSVQTQKDAETFVPSKSSEYMPSVFKTKEATTDTITAAVNKLQISLNETSTTNGKKYANKTTQIKSFPSMGTRHSVGSESNSGLGNSLATSFILGEVNVDVLKDSVYSQFPSLCSIEACPEDVIKLQTLMSEYVEVKNILAKTNAVMKQFYAKTQKWEAIEKDYKQQLQACETQIASLRNENIELKRNIDTKIEHMLYIDETRKKEHDELVQCISEKSSQITALSSQISKLEQQQLASYEYVPKNGNDSKEQPDYVTRQEHQRLLKECERQMSQLLAENLDFKDVQKQYTDEITCLKVNLTASEELIQHLRCDINLLKAKDAEKCEAFTAFESERDRMRDELLLLRQQVEIYSKDFEMERTAREGLAGEKDQLLQDLRALQRKNQELIEQAQKSWETVMQRAQNAVAPTFTAATSAAAFDANSVQRPIRQSLPKTIASPGTSGSTPSFTCPVCHVSFRSLNLVTAHVNSCLDSNRN